MPRNATQSTPTKSTRRAPAKKSATASVIKSLTDDHKKVKKMFDEFMKLKEKGGSDEQKQLIVDTACAELTIHAQLEEELFYPAAREALDDLDMINEAEVEHTCAKQLISELSIMQSSDEMYDAKFIVLSEYVKHHIDEEEKEMFPKMKKANLDLSEMAEELEERRMELRDELGFTAEKPEKKSAARARRKIH